MSIRKGAALAIAQIGVAAFFVPSMVPAVLGPLATWFVLATTILTVFVRAIEIESWALLIPGGLIGRVKQSFGQRAARIAAAVTLVERILLGALAAVVIGHYSAGVGVLAIAGWRYTGYVRPEDLATILAVAAIGTLWIRARLGRDTDLNSIARSVWIGTAVTISIVIWGVVTLARDASATIVVSGPLPAYTVLTGWPRLDVGFVYAYGLGVTLPMLNGGEALARAAHEFQAPRVQALRRTALITLLLSALATAVATFLMVSLVPSTEQVAWHDTPLVGISQHLAAPSWIRDVLALALLGAVVLMLLPAVSAALTDAEQILHRLSRDGTLPGGFADLDSRLGIPARALDVTAMVMILAIVVSGGRLEWLARGYGLSLAAALTLTIAALVRLRTTRAATAAFRAPGNLLAFGREVPFGLIGPGVIIAAGALAVTAAGDFGSTATAVLIGALAFWFTVGGREVASVADEGLDTFDLLPARELSLDHIEARPGNVLVAVRNPHALSHVAAALRTPTDRDVVVMTVRLLGVDVSEDAPIDTTPTPSERRLLSQVVALAERVGRPVRLLVVPAHNVFDAIVATVTRLRSSDVHVGESSSLTADDQARRLGEAWERAEKPQPIDLRLVVHHRSGRSDTYHIGAHPPALTPADFDLIHRLWLDATHAIGPYVHHHDVVRTALTHMEQELNGPQRDQLLSAIRQTARFADELSAALRAGDYARLRDMMRNRHAGEVASLLTALPLEDQVVVFRVLPRKDAAEAFEYLSHEAKEVLLKAMAQEDVAALLNNMAPDDRTLFLDELPASVTRQLLSLLTPKERSVALTLLGYPERSIGRLMTPHYVAVREHWTVKEGLDYIRTHGQDSETLNVIYVVDEHGQLIDDIRIRELLLAAPESPMSSLMDHRFVALKGTDDQTAAVNIFRQYDRSALPVTDSAGMLIGIVTIDDVLDVAEDAATREIQRIGGSEALDEPYMRIALGRMIQKRAGWLTALFLGEMLTATAMGSFEAEISRAVVLALFVPLIISSGGNSGSQASTLVIRALALGEVGLHDWWRVMRRELLVGLSLGAILGTIGFLRITLWSVFSDIYGPHWFLIAVTVAVSLVGVVLWGSLSGSLLPFLLRRLGFDPAASSAPFVATLVDVTGLVIYFSVAIVVLHGTLL